MTRIDVHNAFCYVPAATPPNVIRSLDQETAFRVEGAEHVESFKRGWWDGREHLLKKSRNKPVYYFPTGLLPFLLKLGFADSFEFADYRRPLLEGMQFDWVGDQPRAFQLTAVEKVLQERGPEGLVTGRGLLNLPVRSGKTLTAALIVQRLGLRTLFVVPSDILLMQTVASFKANLGKKIPIGICGSGVWKPRFITVATSQTLVGRPDQYQAELMRTHDILFVDEAHHLEGPEWRVPIIQSDARYKVGLSATIFANKDIPSERSSIWLQAATGPILYRVSMQRLFKEGYLIPPHILWYTIDKPTGMANISYQDGYKRLIEDSEYRNSAIADLAEEAAMDRKQRVLIDTGRKRQMYRIHEMLKARGVRAVKMYGATPVHARMEMIKDFQAKRIQVIVGTVMGEGVDIPELEVVINAEGQKSKEAVIQRMRNLTPNPDGTKMEVTFIDFSDVMHHKLRDHSAARLAMYKGQRGFKVTEDLGVGSDGRFHLPEPT